MKNSDQPEKKSPSLGLISLKDRINLTF